MAKNLFHRCIKQGTRFLSSREIDKDYNGRNGELETEESFRNLECLGFLEMEVKIITIVFWDIQGFSALCHSLEMSPGLLTLFLKEFFEAATQVILEQGGVVDKFLGDGVMALFGTDSNLDHGISTSAICAARCRSEISKTIRNNGAKMEENMARIYSLSNKYWTKMWYQYRMLAVGNIGG